MFKRFIQLLYVLSIQIKSKDERRSRRVLPESARQVLPTIKIAPMKTHAEVFSNYVRHQSQLARAGQNTANQVIASRASTFRPSIIIDILLPVMESLGPRPVR